VYTLLCCDICVNSAAVYLFLYGRMNAVNTGVVTREEYRDIRYQPYDRVPILYRISHHVILSYNTFREFESV
jgi:hypothetical protein